MIGSVASEIHIRCWDRILRASVLIAVAGGVLAYGAYTDRGAVPAVETIDAVLLIALVRMLRSGVIITEERIVIRGLLRTHSLAWARVTGFSPARDDRQHFTAGIETVDGERIRCTAISPVGNQGDSRGRVRISTSGSDPVNQLAEHVEPMVRRRGSLSSVQHQ